MLEAIEKKRQENQFVKYWTPTEKQTEALKEFTEKQKIFGILGGNRCLAKGTKVPTPAGNKSIESIRPGDLVYAVDGTTTPVLECYQNGIKPISRWYGKRWNTEVQIEATADHKVWGATTIDKTPRLLALSEIAKKNGRGFLVRSNGLELGEIRNPYALLLGLLLGDGYLAGHCVQWTCAEPDLVQEVKPYIEGLGFSLRSAGIQHYILCSGTTTGKLRHPFRIELKRLGLLGTKSRTKFIPQEVWSWGKPDVAQLIAGLIASDGSVFQKQTGAWCVSYTSLSEDLVVNLAGLLASGFGIYGSTIHRNKDGWRVTYSTKQAFERLKLLPIPGRKGRLLQEIVKKIDERGTHVKLVDFESLGDVETFDLLVQHPSHTFHLDSLVPVSNSGKSELGTFLDVAWALGKDFFQGEPAWEYLKDLPIPKPPNTIWVVGLDFPTVRDVLFGEKIRGGRGRPALVPDNAEFLKKANDSDFQIFFKNGSILTGKSADSGRSKFQGASVDLVHIDEECEEDVFSECYQRTVDCAGKLLLTLTPLNDIASAARVPWVFNLHQEAKSGRAKDVKFVKLSVLDNPYVPEEEKEKLREKWRGHPEEQARLYGDFVQRAGLVYPMWNKNTHFISRRDIPRSTFRIACIDPANTGPTACLWMAVDPSGNMTGYRTYKQADLTISEHAKNILTMNCGDPIDIWLIDPKWGSQREGQTHKTGAQLYREAGIPVRLAPNVKDENGYGVNPSLEYINATLNPSSRHPKVWFFEDLYDFQDEIERYSWAFFTKGDQKGMSKDKPRKGGDDLLNCFQYLCCFRPKGRRHSDDVLSHHDLEQRAKTNSYYQ